MGKKKKWRRLREFDVEGALVSYGESTGPPLRWPGWLLGASAVNSSEQQCDDDTYLETWEPEGLYSNVEGEAIGDVC